MTNSIEDVCEQAQVILLVGSNPEEAHPVMGMRIRQAVERGAKLIVVDPREFNRDGKPSLDLAAFAKEQGVDDLLVINYPYKVNSVSYINWLNRLVGKDPNWQ